MRKASEIVLKAFLSRCPPERKGALENLLPSEERHRLDRIPTPPEPLPDGFNSDNLLEKVHWSWYLPTLKTYPQEEQKLFLSSLDHHATKNLARALVLSPTAEPVSDVARAFLRHHLISSLREPNNPLLPIDYLPTTPLKPLLALSKREFIRVIDFLALHDLAAELRQIVETKILKKIYSFLSEEERKFLKAVSTQQDPLVPTRIGLDRWDGSEEGLRALLHRRGLARLGVALSGQDPDFVWYICHQLDIGRGNALFKLCAKEPIPGISEGIIRQIEELL